MENGCLKATSLCRTCMESTNEFISLFDAIFIESKEECLNSILMKCTSIEVTKNDLYSQNICQICLSKLRESYLFKKKCYQTQERLEQFYQDDSSKSLKETDPLENQNDKDFPLECEPESAVYSVQINYSDCDNQINYQDYNDDASVISLRDSDNDSEYRSKKLHCTECGKKFWLEVQLQKHIQSHSDTERLKCSICCKEFTSLRKNTSNDTWKVHCPSQNPEDTSPGSKDGNQSNVENIFDEEVEPTEPSEAENVAGSTSRRSRTRSLSSQSSDFDDSDADPHYLSEDDVASSSASTDTLSSNMENEVPEETEVDKPKTKKRRACPSQWQRNKRKFLRNRGQEYKNVKGNLVQARSMGPPCNSCRLKCADKFTSEERRHFFAKYWALANIQDQRSFISRAMTAIRPQYRYPLADNGSNPGRSYNHAFYFEKNDVKIRVCKTFFISTIGVTNRCIRTVTGKTENGFITMDKRGKHTKQQFSEEIMSRVPNHLASIPTVESHYCRSSSTKNYIEGGKTMTDLYNDYKASCQEDNQPFVKIGLYRQLFNYEFNYSFFSPKKDQCQFCESYRNFSIEEKDVLKDAYNKHLREKDLSRELKKTDKESISNSHKVACFDLQASLPTPKGDVSSFYYKSKLSTYHFSVCELNKKGLGDVYSYVWHEGEGSKGAVEIGSCLLKYLEETATKADSDDLEIIFYSDNCGEQGENKYIISMFLYAVTNLKIKSITHRYLVVGHTQNEGDSCHSVIEKNIKKALKGGPIYLPTHYAMLIRTARNRQPFLVYELSHDDFSDLKALTTNTASVFNEEENSTKFNFNDICEIRVEKGNSTKFLFKTSLTEQNYRTVDTTKTKTRRRLQKMENVEMTKAYEDSLPITSKKMKDLISLVENKTIPSIHGDFYRNLNHSEI